MTAGVVGDVIPFVSTRSLPSTLTYRLPADVAVGHIVRAPLASREIEGLVVSVRAEAGGEDLREAVLTGRQVPADLALLALDLAERYATAPARTAALVLPPREAPRREKWLQRVAASAKTDRRRAVLDALADGPLPRSVVCELTGASADLLRRMVLADEIAATARPASPAAPTEAAPPLTDAQDAAVARLCRAVVERDPAPLLLHGVTGSGKTEVFLRGIEQCLALGRSAIVLVPEIALAPQTSRRLVARFGPRVAVVHSAQSPGVRAAAFADVASGACDIVVGPRSAVFAPLADLGLIVVDEEHEAAYKQGSDPRYDARVVAFLRARSHGAALLFASATPRPESWNGLERLALPERVVGVLPRAEVVDLRLDGHYPLSRRLQDALADVDRDGGRAILLLNRRGEASALHCRGCGVTVRCDQCDIALSVHGRTGQLTCHHCGARRSIPRRCGGCGAVDLVRVGAGTERLEDALAQAFPRLDVIRLDAEVTARRGALEAALDRFATGERTVLVGTQIVAKGHDFADVRVAAVIDAEVGLAMPDFRAEERTFSLIVQLAGRAGRDRASSRVIVQSWEPNGRAVELASRYAVAEFLDGELERRAAVGYPPFGRLVRVIVAAPSGPAALGVLRSVADSVQESLAGDRILGPAPLVRLRGRSRFGLLVKTGQPRRAAAVLRAGAAAATPALRRANATIVVDVDPQEML